MVRLRTNSKSYSGSNLRLRRVVQTITDNLERRDVLLARYEDIFDIAGIGIIIYDFEGNIVWVDNTMSRLTGYTVDELSRMNISKIISDEVINELWERTRGQIAGDGGIQRYELELTRKDGTKSAGDIVAIPLSDKGEIVGVQAMVRDITERRQTEEELLRSNEFNFNLIEQSPYPVLVKDVDGTIIRVNPAFERLTGYSSSELVGVRAPYPWWTEQTLEEQAIRRAAALARSGMKFEEEFRKKNGEIFWVEVAPKAIIIEGKFVNQLTLWADITDRKLAAVELLRSNVFNFNLIEQSPYPVVVTNPDGTIERVNLALEHLTGYSASEVIGLKAPFPWWTEQKLERARKHREAALAGSGRKFEEKFRKKNGEIFWVEVFPAAIVIDGKFEHQLNIWVDISDRKKRQKDMEYYVSEVIKAHEDERHYIASELHDGVIQNLSALALDIGGLVSSEKKTSKNIIKNLTQFKSKVSTIINDMRRFCHKLRPDILDRMGLISALHMLAEEMPCDGKLKVNVQIVGESERLSPSTELVLFRVAQEALNNVLKHSQATNASVIVDFKPSELKLTISDNGRGFDSTGFIDSLPGTGKLGLLGIRDRARLVKGSFSLDSQVGKGTSVSIVIPRQKSSSTG